MCLTQIMPIPISMSLSDPFLRSGVASFSCQPEESLLRLEGLPDWLLPTQVLIALQLLIISPWQTDFVLPPSVFSCGLRTLHPFFTMLNLLAPFSACTAPVSPPCLLIWDGPFPRGPCQNRPLFPASSSQDTAKLLVFPSFLRAQTTQRKIEVGITVASLSSDNHTVFFLLNVTFSLFFNITNLK